MLRRPLQCVPFKYHVCHSTYVVLVLATIACLDDVDRARLLCVSQSVLQEANWSG